MLVVSRNRLLSPMTFQGSFSINDRPTMSLNRLLDSLDVSVLSRMTLCSFLVFAYYVPKYSAASLNGSVVSLLSNDDGAFRADNHHLKTRKEYKLNRVH